MKKFAALLLALVLALTALCAVAETAEETVTWISAGIVDEEGNVIEIPAEQIMVLGLAADGTFAMTIGEAVAAYGTWTGYEDGTFALTDENGDTVEAAIFDEDGSVVILIGDMYYVFVYAPEDYFID